MQSASTDMRNLAKLVAFFAVSALSLSVETAFAQEPQTEPPALPPPSAPVEAPVQPAVAPAPAPPPSVVVQPTPMPVAEQPVVPTSGPRDHGVRLGLEFGYTRAASSSGSRLLTNGSPSVLPIGADLSFRIGAKTLAGLHGWVALASRDNCTSGDDCTARSYGVGAHVEAGLVHTEKFDLWFRYAAGLEILYQGGFATDGGGHLFRDAFDVADIRLGGDFVLSRDEEGKTIKIGPYVGANLGFLLSQSGSTGSGSNGFSNQQNLDSSSGDPHVWLSLGLRGTMDP